MTTHPDIHPSAAKRVVTLTGTHSWAVLMLGDCRAILPELPKVDCVVTDPPWELSGNPIEIRGTGVAETKQPSLTITKGAVGEWDEAVIRLCQEVAAADCLFLAGYKELGKLCLACEPLRGVFAWHKPNGSPAAFYPAKLDLSFIVWAGRKSNLYGFQHWPSMVFSVPFPQAGCMGSEREMDRTGKALHPCQGPVALYQKLILPMPTEATVCDPYVGSGTCGVACARLQRNFLGIEIDPAYYEIACRRIRAELDQGQLF